MFGDLAIDMPGAGYTLHATVGGSPTAVIPNCSPWDQFS
jgi:hypothetical protein